MTTTAAHLTHWFLGKVPKDETLAERVCTQDTNRQPLVIREPASEM